MLFYVTIYLAVGLPFGLIAGFFSYFFSLGQLAGWKVLHPLSTLLLWWFLYPVMFIWWVLATLGDRFPFWIQIVRK